MSLSIHLDGNSLRIGKYFALSLQRTLRVPEDGREHPLPPGLGALPLRDIRDLADRLPSHWQPREGFLAPLYQREAMWLGLRGIGWHPIVVKVGAGGINVVSGKPWDDLLHDDPQDYLVCPPQRWLDGINVGTGFVRQFVAMPIGSGYTIEGQLAAEAEVGGLRVGVYEARAGVFPTEPPDEPSSADASAERGLALSPGMGLAAGGQIEQRIYPDPHGIESWDPRSQVTVSIHLLNSKQYTRVTGLESPSSPVTAASYAEFGLPWFAFYDEPAGDLAPAANLAEVETVAAIDQGRGVPPDRENPSAETPSREVIVLGRPERGDRTD